MKLMCTRKLFAFALVVTLNTTPMQSILKALRMHMQQFKHAIVHIPNKGIDSGPAAIAAQCANEEGNFSHFHNLLYNKQGPVDSGWVNNANSKKFASQIPDSSRA